MSFVPKPFRTLIEETLKNTALFEPSSPTCLSIDEAAIEKWVGLTRRIIAIERKYHHDDKTLIRHVYINFTEIFVKFCLKIDYKIVKQKTNYIRENFHKAFANFYNSVEQNTEMST